MVFVVSCYRHNENIQLGTEVGYCDRYSQCNLLEWLRLCVPLVKKDCSLWSSSEVQFVTWLLNVLWFLAKRMEIWRGDGLKMEVCFWYTYVFFLLFCTVFSLALSGLHLTYGYSWNDSCLIKMPWSTFVILISWEGSPSRKDGPLRFV